MTTLAKKYLHKLQQLRSSDQHGYERHRDLAVCGRCGPAKKIREEPLDGLI